MADLNQLTKLQSTLAKQVKAAYEAYKQLAEERKTEKAVQERLVKLQSTWQEFEQRDDEIRQAFPARLDHPYFSENLYDQLEYIYNEFKAELECRRQVVTKRSDKKEKSDDSQPMTLKALINPEVQKMIRKCNLNQMSLQMSMERIVLHNRTKAYYETMINRLQADWAKIQNLNEEIHEVVEDPEQHGFDAHDIYELDEKVQEMVIKLKEQLDADHGRTGAGSSGHQQARTAINLPTITIPKFDGDYLKWPQFHDMFSQMIDNQEIEKVEKMWYPKSNLTGEAQRLIKHLIISAEHYDVAWKILKERYQNKRLLVSCVLDNLINQPNTTSESAKALKTMHDTTRESILMLENIGMKVGGVWIPMLLHILIKKLDTTTHTAYEQSIKNPRELQTLDEFLHFLETRFQSFEALGFKASSTKAGPQRVKTTSCPVVQSPFKCIVCNRVHMLHNCEKFVAMTIQDRESVIRKNNLCYNCLRKGHGWKTCRSINCRTCNQKHHTLLHKGAVASKKGEESQASINITNSINKDLEKYVFLGTALVTVLDKHKRPVECRILLDSGSQINLITERLQKRLRLDAQEEKLRICGIGNAQLDSNDRVNIEVQAKSSHYTTIVEAYVVKQITSMQPQRFIDTSQWKIPKTIELADPNFNKPQKIDILLGAEMYGELMRTKQIKLCSDLPFLQKSVFGWIVLGKMSQAQPREQTVGVTTLQLEEELTKFWEIEEIQESKPLSKVDRQCEEFFLNTTSRDESGRFIVNLPLLNSPELLGESRGIAWRRYENLEKKFSKDPELQRQYSQFLSEYLRLGHMERIQEKEIPTVHYFLPHHAVVNPDKSSTKLRVVFDASCKTTSNLSLNDLMMKGMKVQDDLFDILLRFRTYKHVFMADIKQMYRQIRMADEVTSLLQEAQLKLHKWAASDERLLIGVPLDIREEEKTFDEDDERYIKTLEVYQRITKRNVISEVARLFDPLGLVNPIIVYAKIFIQRLWKHRLDWDEELNDELADYWRKFRNSLSAIHQIKIQRNVIDVNASHRIEIHAFSDASEKGQFKRAIHKLAPLPVEGYCSDESMEPSGTEDGRKRKQVKSAITTSTVHRAKKKRIAANPVSLLLTLFLCPLITFGTSEPIRVTSITNNAGIYFESVGPGRLITNNWKLIVYYNMSNYWHTRNIIQKGIFRLKGLADATANKESLKAIVIGLDQQFKELEDEDRALVGTPTSQSRVKRGIINIVGNIANKLFGVLDDEYAKNIEATIKNVQGRQDELLRLMRNQTSIIDATVDLMSKNQEERTQQLRKFQHEADVILASMDKMASEEQRNKLTTTFLTIAQYTVLLLNELQRIQALFWNILTDVHHGNVNPLIVPAERLAKHVKEIQEVMSTDNELPAVDNLYSIMTARGQINRQLAMFTLEIPLVSPTKYEVFRTIAFPIRINNSFVRIEPEAEFIMVNDYRDEIYALSEFEYHQCRTFRSTVLLCDQLHPVYTKYASHLQCEFSLLAQQTVSEQCQLRISKPERDWIQLQQRNNWLFSMDKETSYNIICTSKKFQIQLKDNGILTFLDSCTLRDDHLTIQSHQGLTTKIEQTVQPVIRFPEEWNTTISTLNIASDIMPAAEKFTARYEVIKKNLNQLKTQEILLTYRATNDQYQMIGGYSVLVIIVLACALWYLITIIKRKRIISSQRTTNIEEGDFNLRPFPQRGGEC